MRTLVSDTITNIQDMKCMYKQQELNVNSVDFVNEIYVEN